MHHLTRTAAALAALVIAASAHAQTRPHEQEWSLQYGHGVLADDHRESWTLGYDIALTPQWWFGVAGGSMRPFRDDASRPAYGSLRMRYRFDALGAVRPHVGVELGGTSSLVYGGSDSVWGGFAGATLALTAHTGVALDLFAGRATSDMDKSYPVDRLTHDRLRFVRAAYVLAF